MDKFYAYFRKQWLRISKNWNIREEDGHFLQMVNRTNNGLESYNRRFNSIFPKTPSLLEFNASVKNESIRQEAILNDIRDGKRHEKVRPAVWIPDIPVCYNKFKTEQKVAEDLGWNVATDLGADLSDTDDDIPTKSNIKKATKAMKPPTKRPAAEPLSEISDNVSGHPKRKTKRPKKSLP